MLKKQKEKNRRETAIIPFSNSGPILVPVQKTAKDSWKQQAKGYPLKKIKKYPPPYRSNRNLVSSSTITSVTLHLIFPCHSQRGRKSCLQTLYLKNKLNCFRRQQHRRSANRKWWAINSYKQNEIKIEFFIGKGSINIKFLTAFNNFCNSPRRKIFQQSRKFTTL